MENPNERINQNFNITTTQISYEQNVTPQNPNIPQLNTTATANSSNPINDKGIDAQNRDQNQILRPGQSLLLKKKEGNYSEEHRVQIYAYVVSALDQEKIRRKNWAPHLREKIKVNRAITRVVQARFTEKYSLEPPHHKTIQNIYEKMTSGLSIRDKARSGRPRKHPENTSTGGSSKRCNTKSKSRQAKS